MKKVLLSAIAAAALSAAPALAADMPVKAKAAPAPVYVSPWDVAFGTAFVTDYVSRGISGSGRNPAVQGYFEGRYAAADWVTLYAGVWGSSLDTASADAEFDISGGARLAYGNFGLDLGYVWYAFPGSATDVNYGEFYAKPSYKVNDWLTVGGQIIGGDNVGNTDTWAVYYTLNAAVTLPFTLFNSVTTTLSGEIGWQTYEVGTDYTTWNIGLAFAYKAVTLDLRYYDTDLDDLVGPYSGTRKLFNDAFVVALKFDTTLSALK